MPRKCYAHTQTRALKRAWWVWLLTFGVHAQKGNCSQFVCLFVCLSVTNLAPAYDVGVTNWTYQHSLCSTIKVSNWQILLKSFLSRVIAFLHFCTAKAAIFNHWSCHVASSIDDHYYERFAFKCFHCYLRHTQLRACTHNCIIMVTYKELSFQMCRKVYPLTIRHAMAQESLV